MDTDMQCSNIAAEAQQFVKDCGGPEPLRTFGGRKYVNGDGFYILVTN
jgi:hypothetical protein